MKKIVCIIAFSSLAFASQPAMSSDTGPGCGIGKHLLSGESGIGANVAAWFLNHAILPQSSSQTSGILGCDTTKQVSNDQQKEKFVASNMDSLSVDMAQGEGDHLTTLASLMGVEEKDHAKFFELTQTNYGTIFGNTETDADMVLSTLNKEMAMSPNLATYVR